MKCKQCGAELKLLNAIFNSRNLCDSCNKNAKLKEAPYKKAEKIFKNECKTYKYISEVGEQELGIIPGMDKEYFVLGISKQSRSVLPKKKLIKSIIKFDFDIDKAMKHLMNKLDKDNKEQLVEEEVKKIKKREEKRKLREQAEKKLYGSPKTKRIALSKTEQNQILDKFNHECAVCGAEEGLHIHHKDLNPKNNKISNLIVLCGVCHKKVHMKVR